MERKSINYYHLIPPIIILLIIGYAIFTNNIISTLFSSLETVLMAFAIVYLLNPIARLIERKSPFNKGFSIVLTFILCFSVVALAVAAMLPPLAKSVNAFIDTAQNPDLIDSILGNVPDFLSPLLKDIDFKEIYNGIYKVIINYSSTLINNVKSIMATAGNLVGFIFNLLLAIFMAYYALSDSDHMGGYAKRLLYAATKKKHADYVMKTCKLADKAVKDFLVGKIITCLILGAMTWVGIVLVNFLVPGIHIPYAPLIGFIIGITNIIPYIGPVFGTIPCLLICLFSGIQESVIFLAIVLITQQIDNIYVGPKILGDSLGVSPFWVVASVAIGGSLFGGIGMIIAVPVVAVTQQLLYEFITDRENNPRQVTLASDTVPITLSTDSPQPIPQPETAPPQQSNKSKNNPKKNKKGNRNRR